MDSFRPILFGLKFWETVFWTSSFVSKGVSFPLPHAQKLRKPEEVSKTFFPSSHKKIYGCIQPRVENSRDPSESSFCSVGSRCFSRSRAYPHSGSEYRGLDPFLPVKPILRTP